MANKFKKGLISCVLAASVGLSCFASACNIKTSHPNAKITIEFNNDSYELEYTLYRNMYPRTVQHFIELADNGFYNDMIVHNYNSSSDWFTGAYSYNFKPAEGESTAEGESITYQSAYEKAAANPKDNGKEFLNYLKLNSKEEVYNKLFNDGKITPTVFEKVVGTEPQNALPTLIGEFSLNDHKIENKALTAKSGSLKMYYYEKQDPNKKATILTGSNQILEHDYRFNCATSIFSMQVGNSTSVDAEHYCVFAEIKKGSDEKLTQLLKKISEHIEDEGYSGKFTTSVKQVVVDELDKYSKAKDEQSFSVPITPIIIKSVKITKY